jgi:hypothetical protein
MDDARHDWGRRIVEAARLAAWLHVQQQVEAEAGLVASAGDAQVSAPQGAGILGRGLATALREGQ